MMLITPDRLIITPLPSGNIHPDMTETEGDTFPEKQMIPHGSARTRNSSRPESMEPRARGYLDRSADQILREEKDAWILRFEDIEEIVITRVRTDSRSSSWLSILFALYPLEPAEARYWVDYQLTNLRHRTGIYLYHTLLLILKAGPRRPLGQAGQ
jgi:hypothetical protein